MNQIDAINMSNTVEINSASSAPLKGADNLKTRDVGSGTDFAKDTTKENFRGPDDSKVVNEDILKDIKANLEKINNFIPVQSTNLVFEFDELGDPPVVKVLDKSSQEIIREIPSKEFREMAKALDEAADKLNTSKGVLFNDSV